MNKHNMYNCWNNKGLNLHVIVNDDMMIWCYDDMMIWCVFTEWRAAGCMVKVSARGSEGRRFDTRLHQLSD